MRALCDSVRPRAFATAAASSARPFVCVKALEKVPFLAACRLSVVIVVLPPSLVVSPGELCAVPRLRSHRDSCCVLLPVPLGILTRLPGGQHHGVGALRLCAVIHVWLAHCCQSSHSCSAGVACYRYRAVFSPPGMPPRRAQQRSASMGAVSTAAVSFGLRPTRVWHVERAPTARATSP